MGSSKYWVIFFVIGIIFIIVSFYLRLSIITDNVYHWWVWTLFIAGIIFILIGIMWMMFSKPNYDVKRGIEEYPEI